MRSLFDDIEDIEIPDEKPPRDTKKILKIVAIVVGVVLLGLRQHVGMGGQLVRDQSHHVIAGLAIAARINSEGIYRYNRITVR